MNKKIKEFVSAIVKGDEVAKKAAFEAAIAEKIQTALEIKKVAVTGKVFNKSK